LQVGEDVATQRLDAALAERQRLEEACESAAGTPAEMASRMRLQASNLQVAVCQRMVNAIRRTRRQVAES
jgi:hypothetical protein